MAYETGTVTTIGELETAFKAFLVANGWTLTGAVHHKGNAYVGIGSQTSPYPRLTLSAGTGQSAGSLTGAGPAVVYLGSLLTVAPLTSPITYYFHTHGDEAYAIIGWAGGHYTHMGFGAAPVAGLPGTGAFYFASYSNPGPKARLNYNGAQFFYAGMRYDLANAAGPYWGEATGGAAAAYVHHGLDGGGWSTATGTGINVLGTCATTHFIAGPLLLRAANAWNGQATLIPVQPAIARGSSKSSIIAELAHMRYVNIANYSPGDLITLGPDTWQVFPWQKKGATTAPGTGSGLDTGYMGVAFRYDGP